MKSNLPSFCRQNLFLATILLLILVSIILYSFKDPTNVIQSPFRTESDCLQGTKYVENYFEKLDQFDPELIQYARTRYISPPPPPHVPYNFKLAASKHKTEYSTFVREIFKNKRNGVFVEAGANEGEYHSHTLELEKELGWSGLLIECNPMVTPFLKFHRRKSYVAGVCISTTASPSVVNFNTPVDWTYSGRMGPTWNIGKNTTWIKFEVETIPLYTLFAAVGFTEIDFFSFDVEGIELKIFKHFPFDKIQINVLIVEVQFLTEVEKNELDEILASNNLFLHSKKTYDHIYFHKNFNQLL